MIRGRSTSPEGSTKWAASQSAAQKTTQDGGELGFLNFKVYLEDFKLFTQIAIRTHNIMLENVKCRQKSYNINTSIYSGSVPFQYLHPLSKIHSEIFTIIQQIIVHLFSQAYKQTQLVFLAHQPQPDGFSWLTTKPLVQFLGMDKTLTLLVSISKLKQIISMEL